MEGTKRSSTADILALIELSKYPNLDFCGFIGDFLGFLGDFEYISWKYGGFKN